MLPETRRNRWTDLESFGNLDSKIDPHSEGKSKLEKSKFFGEK